MVDVSPDFRRSMCHSYCTLTLTLCLSQWVAFPLGETKVTYLSSDQIRPVNNSLIKYSNNLLSTFCFQCRNKQTSSQSKLTIKLSWLLVTYKVVNHLTAGSMYKTFTNEAQANTFVIYYNCTRMTLRRINAVSLHFNEHVSRWICVIWFYCS